MGRIGEVIRDKWVLGLIGKFLRRGPMVDGVVVTSEEGARQFSMKRIYGELGVFRLRGPLREARP